MPKPFPDNPPNHAYGYYPPGVKEKPVAKAKPAKARAKPAKSDTKADAEKPSVGEPTPDKTPAKATTGASTGPGSQSER